MAVSAVACRHRLRGVQNRVGHTQNPIATRLSTFGQRARTGAGAARPGWRCGREKAGDVRYDGVDLFLTDAVVLRYG